MSGQISGIDIHTYLVKEPARAKTFWRDTMELPMTFEMDEGAEFELPDGSAFGLWHLGAEEGGWVKGSGIMFAVPDIHAAVAHYRDRGVSVQSHIEESPVCFMAFAQDSEGNDFILHQRKTG